jgi:hypothetical protein
MKKLLTLMLMVLVMSSFTQAQYKGKYVGWSTGYRFTGTLTAAHYKAFTHIMDFGTGVSGSGTASGGSSSFVNGCHSNTCKALICIGGAGNSPAFTSACATQAGITKLVKSIMASVRASGYDGADMDWEEGEENGFEGNATKIAMFGAFHKEMAESLHAAGKLSTAAVCFDWYPQGSQAAGQWQDQANSMTYYDPVTSMPNFVGPGQIGTVPKTKVGVGFGWGTDNEVTDPNDILAKTRWAIDNGYGGVMAWDICRAASVTSWILDSLARYVTHNPSSVQAPFQIRNAESANLFVRNNRMNGLNEIFYSVPLDANGALVDLAVYDMKGALVKTLVHGPRAAGGLFSVPMQTGCSGSFVVKFSAGSRVSATKAIITK